MKMGNITLKTKFCRAKRSVLNSSAFPKVHERKLVGSKATYNFFFFFKAVVKGLELKYTGIQL